MPVPANSVHIEKPVCSSQYFETPPQFPEYHFPQAVEQELVYLAFHPTLLPIATRLHNTPHWSGDLPPAYHFSRCESATGSTSLRLKKMYE